MWSGISLLFFLFKKIIYSFIFRERGREGERDGGKHQSVVASNASPSGDLACNPGMCLTGIWTGDPLVRRLALNPLSYTNQRSLWFWLMHLFLKCSLSLVPAFILVPGMCVCVCLFSLADSFSLSASLMWVSLGSFSVSPDFFAHCPWRFYLLPWWKNYAHAGNYQICISVVKTSLWAQNLHLNHHLWKIKVWEVWNLVKNIDTMVFVAGEQDWGIRKMEKFPYSFIVVEKHKI